MVKLSGEFILRIRGRLIPTPYSENALPLGLYITRSKLPCKMRTAIGRFWNQFQQGTDFKVQVPVQAGHWFQDSSSRSRSSSSRMLIPSIVVSSWLARFPFWFYQEVGSKVQFCNKRLVVPWYCSPECRTCQVSQNQLRDQNRSKTPNQSALLPLSLSLSLSTHCLLFL